MIKYYTLEVDEDGTLTEIEENEYFENLQWEVERLKHFISDLGDDIKDIKDHLNIEDNRFSNF